MVKQRHAWPGLNGVVIIDSRREISGTTERETRLYATSLTLPAVSLGPIVRNHWAIGNSLHWVSLWIDNASANFTTLKHIALNLTRRTSGKDSLRLKRKVAARDDNFLAAIITE